MTKISIPPIGYRLVEVLRKPSVAFAGLALAWYGTYPALVVVITSVSTVSLTAKVVGVVVGGITWLVDLIGFVCAIPHRAYPTELMATTWRVRALSALGLWCYLNLAGWLSAMVG